MPSFLSKITKGMNCLSTSGDASHSETTGSSSKPHPQPIRKTHDDEGPRPKGSDDSLSSSDSQKSNYVLEVLRKFNIKHINTVNDLVMEGVEGKPLDDKTYLMERIIQLAADLPVESRTSATLTNAFLNQLWTDLQHPPQSYLGTEFVYRKADGSNNNILWPRLGAAGQPYARTVRPRMIQPVAKPDPGLIFDSLLARKTFKPHPNKISSVLFYLASIIIHDIFHTSHQDFSISETSAVVHAAVVHVGIARALMFITRMVLIHVVIIRAVILTDRVVLVRVVLFGHIVLVIRHL
ncbi:hypothetical protein LTR84_006270 [Exophiala bonariae]|uniref:Uncharacterized protein n=1 Tax=Exophiala bonariae TaxID=1690606 RepID=A0AAV9N215_9EURO|nr:hypothetical protein LTR84_006270 [Exophiala bonariae]